MLLLGAEALEAQRDELGVTSKFTWLVRRGWAFDLNLLVYMLKQQTLLVI